MKKLLISIKDDETLNTRLNNSQLFVIIILYYMATSSANTIYTNTYITEYVPHNLK